MTALPKGPTPATAAPYPFSPTVDGGHNPTICHVCGRHAIGMGFGNPAKGDPKYLCHECLMLVEHVRSVRRMDVFELAALDGGVAAVGEYIGTHGITELSHFDELMQRMLVKAAWQGCADALRKELKEGIPF